MEKPLVVKGEHVFPWHFRFLGWALLFVTLPMLVFQPVFSPITLIIGILLIQGQTGMEFDRSARRFREFNSFFFRRFGSWLPWEGFEKVYINSVRTSQFAYTRVNTGTTFRDQKFVAYLKSGSGEKFYITSEREKGKLKERLQPLCKQLDVPLQDNTEEY